MNDQITAITKTEFIEHLRKGVRYVGNIHRTKLSDKLLEDYIPEQLEGRILLNNSPANLKMERVAIEGTKISSKYSYLSIVGSAISICEYKKFLLIEDENDKYFITLYLIDHE